MTDSTMPPEGVQTPNQPNPEWDALTPEEQKIMLYIARNSSAGYPLHGLQDRVKHFHLIAQTDYVFIVSGVSRSDYLHLTYKGAIMIPPALIEGGAE